MRYIISRNICYIFDHFYLIDKIRLSGEGGSPARDPLCLSTFAFLLTKVRIILLLTWHVGMLYNFRKRTLVQDWHFGICTFICHGGSWKLVVVIRTGSKRRRRNLCQPDRVRLGGSKGRKSGSRRSNSQCELSHFVTFYALCLPIIIIWKLLCCLSNKVKSNCFYSNVSDNI